MVIENFSKIKFLNAFNTNPNHEIFSKLKKMKEELSESPERGNKLQLLGHHYTLSPVWRHNFIPR